MTDARRDRLILAGTVLLAVVLRSTHAAGVFRSGDVVLVQRDPWRYRFRLEALTARAQGPLDLSAVVDPGRDDLMVATLGWVAELLGGGPAAVGTVLAVYPVVVAAAMIVLASLAGWWLTGDRRVGLAAAAALAVTPAHAYRTALGFGDHHAFDYFWLAVTFVAVLYLLRDAVGRRERAAATAVLGVALAAQALAWPGGVLLLVPYGVVVLLSLAAALRAGRSPASVAGPFVAGTALAAALALGAFLALSWQSRTTVVLLLAQAATLALLLAVAELGHRYDRRPSVVGGGLLLGLAVVSGLLWHRVPAVGDVAREGVGYFTLTSGTVAEATSLLGGDEPLLDVVTVLGLLVLPFLPALLATTWRSAVDNRPELLALVAYAWYFLGLSLVQRRFAGELALFFALLVGLAAVWAFDRLESRAGATARRPGDAGTTSRTTDGGDDRAALPGTPDVRRLFLFTLVGAFLFAVTLAQVPLTMEHRTVTDAEYGAAQRIEAYAAERGWNATSGYVFSSFQSNPMYNYYAHGQAVDFGYVERNYSSFLVSSDDRQWYRTLERRPTGFVVLSDDVRVTAADSLDARLHGNLGSASDRSTGVGQYRLVYRSDDGSVTVFTPVRGALLSGVGEPGETVRVSTDVSTPGTTFTYERRPTVTASGRFGVVVPYAGTYRVGDRTVRVAERAVRAGRTVGDQGGAAHWTLDEGRGHLLFDRVGGNHAIGDEPNWTAGVRNAGLSVAPDSRLQVRGPPGLDAADGFTLSMWVRTHDAVDYREDRPYPRLVSTATSSAYRNTSGYQLAMATGNAVAAMGNGTDATVLVGPAIDDGRWHHVAMTWDGTELRLYVDGDQRAQRATRTAPTDTDAFVFGAPTNFEEAFVGDVDEVRFRDEAATPAEMRAAYEAVAANRTALSPVPQSRSRQYFSMLSETISTT